MLNPDKIFFNGNILTQDKKQETADAFAVSGGMITAVGDSQSVCSLQHAGTEMIDLNKATVLPGFNDAHIHIWKVGNLMTHLLDLRGVSSISDMQQRLSDYAGQHPELEWIQARGFNEVLFPDHRMPDRTDLDAVIKDRPVCMIRTCAHQLIVNTAALELTGISRMTQTPSGGQIHRMADGTLSGHFTETAMGLVMKHIPSYTRDEYRDMVLAAQDAFLKAGITSATDPAVMPDLLEVYQSMERNGELRIRINAIPIRVPDGSAQPLTLPVAVSTDFLKVNTVKFFADGGLSGKTAALKSPYRDHGGTGVMRLSYDAFLPWAREARHHGFRIATHAIGDAAIDMVLEVYAAIAGENHNNLRNRIEHLGLPSSENLLQMQQSGISAVMQPIFIRELGENFRSYLPDHYLERVYPVKSVLQAGISLAFSTDAPVVKDFNPLCGIQSASDRLDNMGEVIGADQCITMQEALYAYTMGSAIVNGDELKSGSISQGKRADFVILSDDPLRMNMTGQPECKVLETYVGGNKMYSQKQLWQ